ncbi:MAG: HNH endonuclease signature motif containing protein [Bacillota bacterium]
MPRGIAYKYTEEEFQWLKDNIPGRKIYQVIELFKKHFGYEITKLRADKFRDKYNVRSGIKTQWGHGQKNTFVPPKGYHAPGSEKGWFKKGNLPKNTMQLGDIKYGKDGYKYIKVKFTKPSRFGWKLVHHLEWESHYGPIPEGHVVVFKNQNINDIRIENLELITRADHARMCQMKLYSDDEEITATGINIAKVVTVMGKKNKLLKERKRRNEKQTNRS